MPRPPAPPALVPFVAGPALLVACLVTGALACTPASENPDCPSGACPADGAASDGAVGSGGLDVANRPRADANVPPGLVGAYDFDEGDGTVVVDSSGNFFNGGFVGAVDWSQGHAGGDGNFGGGYVTLPPGMLDQARELTLAAWVRVRTNLSVWQRIFDFGRGTGSYFFLTHRSAGTTAIPSGSLRFAITRAGFTNEQILDAPAPLTPLVWKHVAVVLNGASGILYVDGVSVAVDPTMTLRPVDIGPMTVAWLGRSQYVTDPPLDGEIDQVRIYSRALSATEIATLAAPP